MIDQTTPHLGCNTPHKELAYITSDHDKHMRDLMNISYRTYNFGMTPELQKQMHLAVRRVLINMHKICIISDIPLPSVPKKYTRS